MSETKFSLRAVPFRSHSGTARHREPVAREPLATFAAEAEALARREADEWAAWLEPAFNPFDHGAPFYLSSLPEPQLRDWLLDHGLTPPGEGEAWSEWFAALPAVSTSEGQRARATVRQALDKFKLFEVVEEKPKRVAFAVVGINWTWNDESWLDADPEGGHAVQAFRTRAAADAKCEALNRDYQAGNHPFGYDDFSLRDRAGYDPERYGPTEQTTFYEVVEVEVGGEA